MARGAHRHARWISFEIGPHWFFDWWPTAIETEYFLTVTHFATESLKKSYADSFIGPEFLPRLEETVCVETW